MSKPDEPGPTSDRLRHDIDRGRTGDKVDHPDPAAAPLGTDDEAAGDPATTEQINMAAQDELREPVEITPPPMAAQPPRIGIILLMAVAVIVVLWALF